MELVVTPEQLERGYALKPTPHYADYYRLPYKVLRELEDGNYLVDYSHEVVDA